ncbi:MAG: hypothetical protein QOG68_2524 [Solirubrobacteraceae bacterium]|nr:hypothetical protein [Solirubrobacteraceae bacterium]
MLRRFRFAAALALIVSSAGLAACGSSGSGSSTDANALLKATFGPDHSVKSGKLALALALDAKGLKNINGPIALKLDGPFQTEGKGRLPKLDLSLSLSGSGTSFSAGAVSTGDRGWLKLQGTTFLVDAPTFAQFKQGYESAANKPSSSSGPTFRSLGIDPLHWLKNPKVAGTEQAGGVDSYRISAGVDVSAFLDDVSTLLGKAGQVQSTTKIPSSLSAVQRTAIEASVKNASIDVWTGKDDKTLRRIRLAVGIDVPQAIRSAAAGLSTGTLTFDLTINDLNQAQTITAPANARPFSDLRALISGQTAGATGQTTTPTTTTPATTTPPAPSAGSSSKYLTCLTKAGSDVAKIQQCAALAGQ